MQGAQVHITGVVQGVGFRPFVYTLAIRHNLKGWVRNTSAGVDIRVDGDASSLNRFIESLRLEAPPLARIDELEHTNCQTGGFSKFEIISSEALAGAFQPISPDVCICADCLAEISDPSARRYRYPFTNCTNCGPRFTIIEDIPYDRPLTTMASFTMCPDCSDEYQNPLDRRFHAQPIACPVCGPSIWLELSSDVTNPASTGEAALQDAIRLLAEGQILAIKGLGGFHLACDALNRTAVAELRRRKLRVDKPFALMLPDTTTVRLHCHLNEDERNLLESIQRPIVILRRRPESTISHEVAPGQDTLGIMLPYSPLHYLLFAPLNSTQAGRNPLSALVMTSGNLSEEPIATDNDEARQRLSPLADAFLMHNRPIRTRCDDSVVRVIGSTHHGRSTEMPLRRSRGYAPYPVHLPWNSPSILAVGAELKNTFCITREQYAFLSHHIGDLENYQTLCSFENGIQHFERLFRIQPYLLACDLHPDYLATRYALERAQREHLPVIQIQHHHAHIAACMVDNGLQGDQPVIGVSFDGTGYGDDGAIWGGEFLIADYQGYQRLFHLDNVPLPGGDKAVHEPWRMALSWLQHCGLPWSDDLAPIRFIVNSKPDAIYQLEALQRQISTGLNSPPTSSVGRLFDAVSSLVGVRQLATYEAQAAIELETLVDPHESCSYNFDLEERIGIEKVFGGIIDDIHAGVPAPVIAGRFHNTVALLVLNVCQEIRRSHHINQVCLSGGVWQNATLLSKTVPLLYQDNFQVFLHHLVSPNDSGLAIGQAAIAARYLQNNR